MGINSDSKTHEATVLSQDASEPQSKTLAQSALAPKPAGPNRLFAKKGAVFGDWRDDLVRDGYVVVKGAVPRERADKYADEMLTYLETL